MVLLLNEILSYTLVLEHGWVDLDNLKTTKILLSVIQVLYRWM